MLHCDSKNTFCLGWSSWDNLVWHVQFDYVSSEHPLQRLEMKSCVQIFNKKPDPWTGLCFSQLFQIGLLYYLHALNIILYEIIFSNKYQLPCEIRFNSNINGLFSQVLSILCDSSGIISALRTKTTSPAGSQPQVLLEIKQEISALWNKHTQVSHIFWLPVCCQQLHPITLVFALFPFTPTKKSQLVILNWKILDLPLILVPHNYFRLWHWLMRAVQM